MNRLDHLVDDNPVSVHSKRLFFQVGKILWEGSLKYDTVESSNVQRSAFKLKFMIAVPIRLLAAE